MANIRKDRWPGCYSGDPGSIGTGLCRILLPDIREFTFYEVE
jgi:hypothetical protein